LLERTVEADESQDCLEVLPALVEIKLP